MTSFNFAHSDSGDWAGIASNLAEGLTGEGNLLPASDEALLGFLYVTNTLAGDLGSILAYLRQTTGIGDWVGAIGMGVAATGVEYFGRPAGVALAASLPKDGFFVFPPVGTNVGTNVGAGMEDFPAEGKDWVERVSPPFGIVHGDPGNPNAAGIIEDLGLATAGFLVGGMSASSRFHAPPSGGVPRRRVSGPLFAPLLEVATRPPPGSRPHRPPPPAPPPRSATPTPAPAPPFRHPAGPLGARPPRGRPGDPSGAEHRAGRHRRARSEETPGQRRRRLYRGAQCPPGTDQADERDDPHPAVRSRAQSGRTHTQRTVRPVSIGGWLHLATTSL